MKLAKLGGIHFGVTLENLCAMTMQMGTASTAEGSSDNGVVRSGRAEHPRRSPSSPRPSPQRQATGKVLVAFTPAEESHGL
jgi:hypothetical protein